MASYSHAGQKPLTSKAAATSLATDIDDIKHQKASVQQANFMTKAVQ